MKKTVIDMLKFFALVLLGTVLTTPLLMKACDAEYEYQQAKQEQWQQDSKDGVAFTDFNN